VFITVRPCDLQRIGKGQAAGSQKRRRAACEVLSAADDILRPTCHNAHRKPFAKCRTRNEIWESVQESVALRCLRLGVAITAVGFQKGFEGLRGLRHLKMVMEKERKERDRRNDFGRKRSSRLSLHLRKALEVRMPLSFNIHERIVACDAC
jgi:hypothetical protein